MGRYFRIAFAGAAIFVFVMAILPHPPVLPNQLSDKVQHFMAFTTLGILGAYGFAGRRVLALFAGLTIYGAAIELFQAIPMLHRDSDIVDLLVDMAAAGIALLVTREIMALRDRP